MIRNVATYLAFPVVSNDLSGLSRTDISCDDRGVLRKLISFLRSPSPIAIAIAITSMDSFTRALSFLRHVSFVLRHFTFLTHHFSPVTFFFLFAPCLTKAYLLITLLPFL